MAGLLRRIHGWIRFWIYVFDTSPAAEAVSWTEADTARARTEWQAWREAR